MVGGVNAQTNVAREINKAGFSQSNESSVNPALPISRAPRRQPPALLARRACKKCDVGNSHLVGNVVTGDSEHARA